MRHMPICNLSNYRKFRAKETHVLPYLSALPKRTSMLTTYEHIIAELES